MVGGVTLDRSGATTLPGLWAAGEVTSSGLHGANRLASNSLLESVVFGALAGAGASRAAVEIGGDDFRVPPLRSLALNDHSQSLDVADIRNSLKSLMWRAAGVERDGKRLTEAARSIEHWCRYALTCQFSDPEGWELQNMLIVARLMIDAALRRQESRGVHFRRDFPEIDDRRWKRHITFCRPRDEG